MHHTAIVMVMEEMVVKHLLLQIQIADTVQIVVRFLKEMQIVHL